MSPERDDAQQELADALDGLRQEIRSRFGPRDLAPGERAEIDWIALFEELRRRANAFGIVERSGEVDEFGADALRLCDGKLGLAVKGEKVGVIEL